MPRGHSACRRGGYNPIVVADRTISHYRLLGVLGEGGMGVVYKAEDTRLHRFVALKLLSDRIANDPSAASASTARLRPPRR